MKLRNFLGSFLVALILLPLVQVVGTSPAAAGSDEVAKLGKITPNGPYRLWTAINGLLPSYAALKGGAGLRTQVENMVAVDAFGKKPGDVMVQTVDFRNLLETIRDQSKRRSKNTPLRRPDCPAAGGVKIRHWIAFHRVSGRLEDVLSGDLSKDPTCLSS